MGETHKLAAILVADVVGYSRLAASDEDRTLARLRGLRSDLIDPAVAAHHGRIVKRTGDGLIAEFRSVVDAVRCAIEVQIAMGRGAGGDPPWQPLGSFWAGSTSPAPTRPLCRGRSPGLGRERLSGVTENEHRRRSYAPSRLPTR